MRSSFLKLARNEFDVHLIAPGSFKELSCLYRCSVDPQYASAPSPAIERGCSVGANHAPKLSADAFSSGNTRRDRTIWDHSSTFQQARCASSS
jgi:hypothetical protein